MIAREIVIKERVPAQHQLRTNQVSIAHTDVGQVAFVERTRPHLSKQNILVTLSNGVQIIHVHIDIIGARIRAQADLGTTIRCQSFFSRGRNQAGERVGGGSSPILTQKAASSLLIVARLALVGITGIRGHFGQKRFKIPLTLI